MVATGARNPPSDGTLLTKDLRLEGHSPTTVSRFESGIVIDRVDTGSRIANGLFLTAGGDRDVYHCSTLTLARVAWR